MDPITKYRLTHESYYIVDPELGRVEKANTVYAILMTAVKIAKMMKYKKYRACSRYEDNMEAQDICEKEYDLEITRKQIDFLHKALMNCSQNKNPQGCKDKITNAIRKKEMKYNKIQQALTALKTPQ